MTPTLLELAVAIVLVVVAWQIGLAIAPGVIRVIRGLRRDVDAAADEALTETQDDSSFEQRKEHTNGTHRR